MNRFSFQLTLLLVQLKVLGLSLVHLLGLNLFMSPGERTNIKLVHEINPNWSNPGKFTSRVLYSIPFVGNSDFISGPRTLQYKGMKANHQSADQWKSRIASWGTAVLARFSTTYIESTFGVVRVEYAPIVGLTIHNVFNTNNILLHLSLLKKRKFNVFLLSSICTGIETVFLQPLFLSGTLLSRRDDKRRRATVR